MHCGLTLVSTHKYTLANTHSEDYSRVNCVSVCVFGGVCVCVCFGGGVCVFGWVCVGVWVWGETPV